MGFLDSAFGSAVSSYSQGANTFANFTGPTVGKIIGEVGAQVSQVDITRTLMNGDLTSIKRTGNSVANGLKVAVQRMGMMSPTPYPGQAEPSVVVPAGALLSPQFAVLASANADVIDGKTEFRGKLKAVGGDEQEVLIETTPSFADSRQVDYEEFQAIHSPGGVAIYNKTRSREFKLSWTLVSRNQQEATKNLKYLQYIRRWAMPDYGEETDNRTYLNTKGAPPPIIEFSLYGQAHFKDVPTVLTSYNFTYPDDIDYIPTDSLQPFPIVATIEVSLKETWSASELSGRSGKDSDHLYAYHTGDYTATTQNSEQTSSTMCAAPADWLAEASSASLGSGLKASAVTGLKIPSGAFDTSMFKGLGVPANATDGISSKLGGVANIISGGVTQAKQFISSAQNVVGEIKTEAEKKFNGVVESMPTFKSFTPGGSE